MATRLTSRLRTERTAQGWTQSKLAELAGITRQSYAAVESGASVPATDVALRLARALGLGVEALFSLPDAPPATAVVAAAGGVAAAVESRVRLARVGGRTRAYPLAGTRHTGEMAADGVVLRLRPRAAEVEVALFAERPPEPSLVVLGCDPSFGLLAESLRREWTVEVYWEQRGSLDALEALARGEAHVAGIHLIDPATGEYNAPWVERVVPFRCTRVGYAIWEEALVVGAGNPLGLREVADLARPGIRLVNREPGSGTRRLLDERLEAASVRRDAVLGYHATAARSHRAVAEAVASGLADAGVAIRAAALAFGLDAVTLARARYDLVIPDHYVDLPAVQRLLEQLRLTRVRAQVEALGGYDIAPMGLPA